MGSVYVGGHFNCLTVMVASDAVQLVTVLMLSPTAAMAGRRECCSMGHYLLCLFHLQFQRDRSKRLHETTDSSSMNTNLRIQWISYFMLTA